MDISNFPVWMKQPLYEEFVGAEAAQELIETPHLERWFIDLQQQASGNETLKSASDEIKAAIRANPEVMTVLAGMEQESLDGISAAVIADPQALIDNIDTIGQSPQDIASILGVGAEAAPAAVSEPEPEPQPESEPEPPAAVEDVVADDETPETSEATGDEAVVDEGAPVPETPVADESAAVDESAGGADVTAGDDVEVEAEAEQPPAPDDAATPAAPEPELPAGFEEFVGRLATNETLGTAFMDIMAGGAADPDPDFLAQKLAQLEGLAAQDPDFFLKMNQIIDRPGYTEFLQAAGDHEGLREVFQDMLGSFDQAPQQSIAFLDAVHSQAMQNDNFFSAAADAIHTKPGLVDTFVTQFRENPNEAVAQLDMFSRFMTVSNGMTEVATQLLGPEFGQMVSGLVEAFLGFIQQFLPQLNEIMEAFGTSLSGVLSPQGDQQSGGPAAPAGDSPAPAPEQPPQDPAAAPAPGE